MSNTLSWSLAVVLFLVLVYFLGGYNTSIGLEDSYFQNESEPGTGGASDVEVLYSYLSDTNNIVAGSALKAEPMQIIAGNFSF